MTHHPTVTIGLPVFNGENYLEQAIQSILRQTYEDFELVISDNASTDWTAVIASRYASTDRRIRYIRQSRNLGAAPNFNLLIDESRGHYFKWAAHDDVLAPEFLSACVRVLDAHPSVMLAYPRAEVIDAQGRFIERYDVRLNTDSEDAGIRFRELLLSWHRCYEIFGVFRKSALLQTDLMEAFWGADRTLLQEVALLGPFFEIPRYSFHPRSHAEQSITKMRGQDIDRTYWSDTKSTGGIVLPAWNIVLGNLRLVRKTDVKTADKLRLCRAVADWSLAHWKELTRDVARAARHTWTDLRHGKSPLPAPSTPGNRHSWGREREPNLAEASTPVGHRPISPTSPSQGHRDPSALDHSPLSQSPNLDPSSQSPLSRGAVGTHPVSRSPLSESFVGFGPESWS